MHRILLFLILLCLAGWVPKLFAQANVLPEPSILPTVPNSGWPIEVTVPGTGAQPSARVGSVLELCASRLGKWPEAIEEACQELILEAARAQRQRLDKAAELDALVDPDTVRFRSEHTKATLEDQRAQGTFVFWAVVAVILVGLIAAIAQFVRSFCVQGDTGSAEIAISNNELKFRTTWLGVLLLGMSMGFLFLYLAYVYPVRFVGQ